ncbi:MAG TPA: right-handed parallel beta-helix repeat-containing protein [Kofleriaceae bacterium]|jgi:hypothetical protein
MRTLLLLAFLCSCQKDNPYYCESAPLHNCLDIDSPPMGCTGDESCASPTPVCDPSSRACVVCTSAEPSACTSTTPLCGTDDTCHACTTHASCGASDACLPDGSCGTDSSVAHVDPSGSGSSCTAAAPCPTFAAALATHRPFIRLHGQLDEAVAISDQDVTVLGDSTAVFTRTTNGIIVTVSGSSHVTFYDVTITGASGSAGYGVSVPAGATGSFSLYRSVVSSNSAGGVSLSGATFAFVDDVFFNNGGNTSLVGALSLASPQDATNRLEFDTFSKNAAMDGVAPAIQCIAGTFTARNNILSDNGTLSNMNQVGGTCAHSYSIVRPGSLPAGTGNSASDPLFVDPAHGDLHLQSGSPAIGAADPASDLSGIAATDLDGIPRTAPADLGAYQHQGGQ